MGIVVAVTVGAVVIIAATGLGGSPPGTSVISKSTSPTSAPFPVGVLDPAEPSGLAPPTASALRGYQLVYESDFNGSHLPNGWTSFAGVPTGASTGPLAPSHVVVHGGLLVLRTYRDPAYANQWVSGGLCQCGDPRTYGAFFVRSRITGPGPSAVSLLWPASNVWPPEIDFDENGGNARGTSATVHFGPADQIEQHSISIDMTRWHTWGIIWTPTTITFTVDGQSWAQVTTPLEIPNVPMRLDLEQRTACGINLDCPSRPQSLLVDWIAEYSLRH